MSRPSFFKPMVEIQDLLTSAIQRTASLADQVKRANSPDLRHLHIRICDLESDLRSVHADLRKARQHEAEIRTRPYHRERSS